MNNTTNKHKKSTNQRTGFDDCSSSQKQSFTSGSTLTQNSMNNSSFSMSAKMLLPLVMRLKEQNDSLSIAKNKLNQQMSVLQNTAHCLLNENQHLKQHYFTRTNDLRSMIHTIGVNNSFSLQQIQQLQFTFRENNCKIYKDVHMTDQNTKHLSKQINHLSSMIKKSKNQLIERQKQLISKNVKNKQTRNSLEYLQKHQTYNRIYKLEEEINRNIIEMSQIKQKNTFCLTVIAKEKKNNQKDKPAIKKNTIKQFKKIHSLKEQLQEEQKQFQLGEAKASNLSLKAEITLQNRLKCQQQYAYKLASCNRYEQQIEATVLQIKKLVNNLKVDMKNHEVASGTLKNMERNLKRKIENSTKNKLFREEKLKNIEKEAIRNIHNIKSKIQSITQIQQKFITQTINKESKTADLRITEYRQQYEDVQQKIVDIEECIDKQHSPNILQNIIKMEHQLNNHQEAIPKLQFLST